MFGIGMTEMLVVAVIALIFIGPDQIPEVARTLGRFLNDLRRSTDDLKREFNQTAGIPKTFDEWLAQQKKLEKPALGAPLDVEAPVHLPEPLAEGFVESTPEASAEVTLAAPPKPEDPDKA